MISYERILSLGEEWGTEKLKQTLDELRIDEPHLYNLITKSVQIDIDQQGEEIRPVWNSALSLLAFTYKAISVPKGVN